MRGQDKYTGPTGEKNIRKVLVRGQPRFLLQMGRRGKGNRRAKLFKTLGEAIATKQAWLAGGVPRPEAETLPTPEMPETTVEDALRLHASADARSTTGVLGKRYPELLGFPLEAVTADHCAVFRRRYEAAGLKPSGLRTHMGTLRAAIRRLRPEFHLPPSVFPDANYTRHRVLARAELKRAYLATPEPFATMARLAEITFMRQGEIRTLRREMVDLRARTITLPRAKAGPRVVSLGEEACALLRHVLASHVHEVVFPRDPRRAGPRSRSVGQPYSRKQVSHMWRKSMDLVGRHDVTFHDLRHHAAMTALANGASFPELQALGGWATPKMVNRYATASNDRLRQLQDRGARHQALRRR